MAAFPSYAKILYSGFAVKRRSAVKRTEFEDGFAKQAKRWSRVLVERTVSYGFSSKADYESFITWFNTTINRGADWFDWTDPVTSTIKTARIKGGDLEEEVPESTLLTHWKIRFTLEVWDA